jgi:hypothetical protein
VLTADESDVDAVKLSDHAFRPRLGKLDAGQTGEEVHAVGRDAKLDNLVGLCEIFRREVDVAETKIIKRANDISALFVVGFTKISRSPV